MHSFLYIRLSEPYGCLGLIYLSPLARWTEQGSNWWPCDQQSDALTTAPPHHTTQNGYKILQIENFINERFDRIKEAHILNFNKANNMYNRMYHEIETKH